MPATARRNKNYASKKRIRIINTHENGWLGPEKVQEAGLYAD